MSKRFYLSEISELVVLPCGRYFLFGESTKNPFSLVVAGLVLRPPEDARAFIGWGRRWGYRPYVRPYYRPYRRYRPYYHSYWPYYR